MLLRVAISVVSIGVISLGAGAACCQDYPNKSIRVVTGGVGGTADISARVIAQGLTESLGQQVVVDNRGNATGDIVAKAVPDGYTLLYDAGSVWISPLLQATPYDPVRDFSPITTAISSPNVLVVPPSLPVASVKDLIALAKASPGKLNFASTGIGGSTHLGWELFKAMAGVNIVHVPYKVSSLALVGLMGGEVQMVFAGPAVVAPFVASGKIKALAVTSPQPSALFPNLPTVAASGVPGYESFLLLALLAPAKTPVPVINRLNQDTARFLNRPDIKQKFLSNGVEAVSSSPEKLAATMKSDIAKWTKVIKDAGIKID